MTASQHTVPVALVTGSGRRRLGYHVALALRDRGYRVALHAHAHLAQARQSAAAWQAAGHAALALGADLRSEEQIERMFQELLDHWGRIDLLVNTASVWEAVPLERLSAQAIRHHWEVNALGTFLCALAAGRQMIAQSEGGLIVNFGDWATTRPYRHYAAYFAAKGAVEALTRSLAVELGTRNPRVRVNALLPGPVLLPEDMDPKARQRVIDATLVKQQGGAAAVVQAVLALVDNPFLTGVCLPVDGGRSIYCPAEQ